MQIAACSGTKCNFISISTAPRSSVGSNWSCEDDYHCDDGRDDYCDDICEDCDDYGNDDGRDDDCDDDPPS